MTLPFLPQPKQWKRLWSAKIVKLGVFSVVKRTQALVTVGGPVALELQAVALTVFQQRIVANHRLAVRLLPLFLFGEGA